MAKRTAWLILILLAAASLRLVAIDSVPPGLTHDEADHGLDAWGVVNGIRPVYFTVGYGREPLYDYATALLMVFLGPSYLAGRLASAFLSLILIAGTYAWANRAFGHKIALLTAAGLAVSFWAVMTGRQALRSVTLPTLFVLASYLFWRGLELSRGPGSQNSTNQSSTLRRWPSLVHFALSGILLGTTFYTYVPARVMWLLFPATLLFLLIYDRDRLKSAWPGTLLALLLALLVTSPLLLFLNANPGVEERVAELSGPLTAAKRGEFGPILENAVRSLLLPAIEGDSQWRYNIPGRPFLSPIMAILFFFGLAIGASWLLKRARPYAESGRSQGDRLPCQVGYLFALSWLALGLSPALISGPDLSTTRAIGLLPVLYVFPAIALAIILDWQRLPRRLMAALVILLFSGLYLQTASDYFVRWAGAPQVRVQYESSLVETLAYIKSRDEIETAISTTTPNQFHSPAVAKLMLAETDTGLRWFNGNHSLLLPHSRESRLVFSGFAPLNPLLAGYLDLTPTDEILTMEDDIDRPLEVFEADGLELAESWADTFESALLLPAEAQAPLKLGESVEYLGYQLLSDGNAAGDEVFLATLWRVLQPLNQAVLFTHVLDSEGSVVAQADQLDVPGDFWVAGDVFIQLHQISMPADLPNGEYHLAVGIYTTDSMQRLPVMVNNQAQGDSMVLPEVLTSG